MRVRERSSAEQARFRRRLRFGRSAERWTGAPTSFASREKRAGEAPRIVSGAQFFQYLQRFSRSLYYQPLRWRRAAGRSILIHQ